jgi:hypothetical protein
MAGNTSSLVVSRYGGTHVWMSISLRSWRQLNSRLARRMLCSEEKQSFCLLLYALSI